MIWLLYTMLLLDWGGVILWRHGCQPESWHRDQTSSVELVQWTISLVRGIRHHLKGTYTHLPKYHNLGSSHLAWNNHDPTKV